MQSAAAAPPYQSTRAGAAACATIGGFWNLHGRHLPYTFAFQNALEGQLYGVSLGLCMLGALLSATYTHCPSGCQAGQSAQYVLMEVCLDLLLFGTFSWAIHQLLLRHGVEAWLAGLLVHAVACTMLWGLPAGTLKPL